jgi:hypothetical protein
MRMKTDVNNDGVIDGMMIMMKVLIMMIMIILNDKNSVNNEKGDSYKTTYDFSEPSAYKLLKLKIPVLICYGTKDWSASYNDMFQVETIRRGIKNISFIPYFGLEHNYFPVDEKRQPNYESYNWENVGKDWVKWLNSSK